MQSRWRSPVAWGTLVGLIVLVFQVFGLYEKMGIEQSELNHILNGLIAVFIAFGILNDPTNKEGF